MTPLIELAEREEQDHREEQIRVELDRPFLIEEDKAPWPEDTDDAPISESE